jgi:plastocyanin
MRHASQRQIVSLAIALIAGLLAPAAIVLGQGTASVVIGDELEPARLEVAPGTSVTWRNDDDERHRMRSRSGPQEFDSGNLEPGETYTFTFTIEGSYPYIDEREDDDADYHGTIVVVAAASPAGASPAGTLAASAAISLIDETFVPSSIEVATGATVTWSNDDGDDTHTVTADDGTFTSDILEGGATFRHTFSAPGTFPYACLIHPEMRATIVVSGPAVTVSPSASAGPSASASPSASAGPSASTGPPAPGSASPLAPGAPVPVAAEVSLAGRAFQPADVTVPAKAAVRWLNDDGEGHTVTAVDGSFNSGVLTVGNVFTETFETPGSFDYFCAIHPEMRGTVTVTE